MAPLPGWERAEIDPRKFTEYVLAPEHVNNGNKWLAYVALGFRIGTLQDRQGCAQDISMQIRESLEVLPDATFQMATPFGDRYSTEVILQGPNGRHATALVIWQVEPHRTTLVTLWLRTHNRRRNEGESLR